MTRSQVAFKYRPTTGRPAVQTATRSASVSPPVRQLPTALVRALALGNA